MNLELHKVEKTGKLKPPALLVPDNKLRTSNASLFMLDDEFAIRYPRCLTAASRTHMAHAWGTGGGTARGADETASRGSSRKCMPSILQTGVVLAVHQQPGGKKPAPIPRCPIPCTVIFLPSITASLTDIFYSTSKTK